MHRNDGVAGLPAFILAAPGKDEEKAKRPAAGDTGLALNRILASLHSLLPEVFPSTCRYQYRIANAYSKALYKSDSNNKTSPNVSDVDTDANKKRLLSEVKDAPLVIALAPSAKRLAPYLKANGCNILDFGEHPGQQAINGGASKYKTYNGVTLKSAKDHLAGPNGATIRRLARSKERLEMLLSQMRYHSFAETGILGGLRAQKLFDCFIETSIIPNTQALPEPCEHCQAFHQKRTKNWETIEALLPFL
ncbi:hypothetical protein [Corallococcus sp. AB049A]|uniref:hypothetical protein n=1 Tax=Corallococcus sp. AB049A TaxID=2316721 RepID=UPI0011C41FC6|nr:hypothetical protein [Corallococcus sp. AB049A]